MQLALQERTPCRICFGGNSCAEPPLNTPFFPKMTRSLWLPERENCPMIAWRPERRTEAGKSDWFFTRKWWVQRKRILHRSQKLHQEHAGPKPHAPTTSPSECKEQASGTLPAFMITGQSWSGMYPREDFARNAERFFPEKTILGLEPKKRFLLHLCAPRYSLRVGFLSLPGGAGTRPPPSSI